MNYNQRLKTAGHEGDSPYIVAVSGESKSQQVYSTNGRRSRGIPTTSEPLNYAQMNLQHQA